MPGLLERREQPLFHPAQVGTGSALVVGDVPEARVTR